VRNSLPHWALVLALTLAALPRAGSAGVRQVALSPLFNPRAPFKNKTAVKLKFQAKDASTGKPVAKEDIVFSLLHGPKDPAVELKARQVKAGVFEVPFAPQGPGQYAVVVSVRGTQLGSIAPVKLGVVGVADGIIELGPERDSEMTDRAKRTGWKGGR
jgi:hypothetical protein